MELVCNEILDRRAGVQWEDIAGQQDAKCLVQELVVWPMLNPDLFTVSAMCALCLPPPPAAQFSLQSLLHPVWNPVF